MFMEIEPNVTSPMGHQCIHKVLKPSSFDSHCQLTFQCTDSILVSVHSLEVNPLFNFTQLCFSLCALSPLPLYNFPILPRHILCKNPHLFSYFPCTQLLHLSLGQSCIYNFPCNLVHPKHCCPRLNSANLLIATVLLNFGIG